uniref:Lipoprotein n=1 Tax=Cupriavidus pinatubonensis (strain JMP 134 / LMG 1197) TaxID=264198 RepID=Q476P4_CUPPJ
MRRAFARTIRLLTGAAALASAACAPLPPAPSTTPAIPVAATIAVVARDWHTDVCLRSEDAGAGVHSLASGFEDVRYLCFGFGDRSYVVRRNHGIGTMLLALVPGRGVVLMTALRAPPADAFGAENVVSLAVGDAGLEGLQTYLRNAVERNADGGAIPLGAGPYEGGAYLSATAAYSLLYTCNTWTANALRHAGLPLAPIAVFADDVMMQVRRIGSEQQEDGLVRVSPLSHPMGAERSPSAPASAQ